jgi:hypothetical protein
MLPELHLSVNDVSSKIDVFRQNFVAARTDQPLPAKV